jgi:hypothetical protein
LYTRNLGRRDGDRWPLLSRLKRRAYVLRYVLAVSTLTVFPDQTRAVPNPRIIDVHEIPVGLVYGIPLVYATRRTANSILHAHAFAGNHDVGHLHAIRIRHARVRADGAQNGAGDLLIRDGPAKAENRSEQDEGEKGGAFHTSPSV